MTPRELSKLQEKYFAGLCSPEEIDVLMHYEDGFQLIDEAWHPENGDQQQLKHKILEQLHQEMEPASESSFRFMYYYAAAAVLLIGVFTILFYPKTDDSGRKLVGIIKSRHESIIKPGSNKATLTLSDGSVINRHTWLPRTT